MSQTGESGSVIEAFLRQAEDQPLNDCLTVCEICKDDSYGIGVMVERSALQYGQAKERASRLAHVFRDILLKCSGGLKKDRNRNIVAVATDDLEGLLLSQVATMMANCIYLPINVNDPRNSEIIRLCNPFLVIIDEGQRPFLESISDLDTRTFSELEYLSRNVPPLSITLPASNDISHIFFTSGTTGKPKGVISTHSNLWSFAREKAHHSLIENESRVFVASSKTFDPHFGDVVASLSAGATICFASSSLVCGGKLTECLFSCRATHVTLTPTVWSMRGYISKYPESSDDEHLEKVLPHLTEICLGGESMPFSLTMAAQSFQKLRIVNTYGVTEATVYQSFFCINEIQRKNMNYKEKVAWCNVARKIIGLAYDGVAIGLRLDNGNIRWPYTTSLNVCSDSKRLRISEYCPSCLAEETLTGEIILAGDQIGLAYLGASEKENQRFCSINDDFAKAFCTGDIGRLVWLPAEYFNEKVDSSMLRDGEKPLNSHKYRLCDCRLFVGPFVELIGRKDLQIKHLGVRIEVEEIEAVLGLCSPIVDAVAVVKHNKMGQLVAFISNEKIYDGLVQKIDNKGFVRTSIPLVLPRSFDGVLRLFCSKKVPACMIPATYAVLKSFGDFRSSNGKLKRSDLSDIECLRTQHANETDIMRSSALETLLANIWSEHLGVEPCTISPDESFRSLGGDSLDAQKVSQSLIKIVADVADNNQDIYAFVKMSRGFGELKGGLEPLYLLQAGSLREYAEHLKKLPFGKVIVDSKESMTKLLSKKDKSISKRAGSRVSLQNMDNVEKLLYLCAAEGNVSSLIVLLDCKYIGASPNAGVSREKRAKTPLHVAAANGHADVIRTLLHYGADPFRASKENTLPIHVASSFEGSTAVSMIRLLMDAMASRKIKSATIIRDGRKQTLLHACARGGNIEAMRFLIKKLSDDFPNDEATRVKYINCIDRWNRTALHWAIINNHEECVRYLVDSGANIVPMIKLSQQTKGTHLPYENPVDLARRRKCSDSLIAYLDSK